MSSGFLLGKFLPPHNGHVYLAQFAQNYVDDLTIMVCSLPEEPIPGHLRAQWMRELFPNAHVEHYPFPIQQEPNGPDDKDFWKAWKRAIAGVMSSVQGDNWDFPDYVFASETYGHRLAAELGAEFVPVDPSRTGQKVSGTAVRTDPYGNWSYIPHVVRPYYAKRAVLFGPESCGKTTLGIQLAKRLQTVYVPEYGRTYTETFGTSIEIHDLAKIVRGHTASVAAAKRHANKVLIEDTDPLMTVAWARMFELNFEVQLDKPDLYIMCDLLPWENDGTRYFPEEVDRRRFFNVCIEYLQASGVPYVIVSGNKRSRLEQAVSAVEGLF